MRWNRLAVGAFGACLLLAGCDGADRVIEPSTTAFRAESPVIVAEQISVEELPGTFDETRTYVLRVGQAAEPEVLLWEIWAAGMHPERAWLALDNRCMDPIGPRFTVELFKGDPRIGDHGFDPGVGRLFCATTLMEYTVIEQPEAQ